MEVDWIVLSDSLERAPVEQNCKRPPPQSRGKVWHATGSTLFQPIVIARNDPYE